MTTFTKIQTQIEAITVHRKFDPMLVLFIVLMMWLTVSFIALGLNLTGHLGTLDWVENL